MKPNSNEVIERKGNFESLITFKKATVIYDITFYFCHKYLSRGDRTIDQMVQAARSGKQNIAEGSAASVTSTQNEIHLTNVAKASLQELLVDYQDYLRARKLRKWEEDSKELLAMREVGKTHEDSEYYMKLIETRPQRQSPI